jgi:polyphosphate kinase 2 (PPK2 family)
VADGLAVYDARVEARRAEVRVFETAQLGRKVTKEVYEAEVPVVQAELLALQQALRAAGIATAIIVSGVEGSGKGEVVNRLNEWLDPRGVRTHAFWEESDDERQRPRYWRFWRQLPGRGTIGVLFGSWYTQPVIDHAFERTSATEYERELRRIEELERLLTDDGMLVVKLWFHLRRRDQKKRLERDVKDGRMSAPLVKKLAKKYDRFVECSERAIRMTDTGHCPWIVIEATDRRYRDLAVGRALAHAMREQLERADVPAASAPAPTHVPQAAEAAARAFRAADAAADAQSTMPAHQAAAERAAEARAAAPPRAPEHEHTGPHHEGVEQPRITVLDRVDLSASLSDDAYDRRMDGAQRRLGNLAWEARERGRNTVAVFEGWDAAGKGGAIRRVARAVDARLLHAISIAAPTDEERAHPYLWRFWRHVPRAGHMTIYDRSWYGRVLVERVEAFAREHEWRRAYQEINDFEEQLVEHGVVLLKLWLHISPEEQLRRFEERQQVQRKQHKITAEDWRNREKWGAYAEAVEEMVARTSTSYAPWTLVAANDKKHARVEVLETFCRRLDRALHDRQR